MRILQVCPYDWDAPGGVQMHVERLSDELRGRGHEVRIVAPGQAPSEDPNVDIVGRPVRVRFNGTTAPVCPSPVAGWQVYRLLQRFRPTVIHAHEPFAPSLSCYAGLVARAPVVATFHAHCDARIGPWLYALGTWPLNQCVDAGIAVSEAATSCLGRGVRVPFQIVPNGVDGRFFDLDAPAPPTGAPARLLFAHRLEPRKGLRVALEAFERLGDDFPDVRLDVVGDGQDSHLVEQLAPALRRRVSMLGTVSREDLLQRFASAHVFLAPALWGESFGMVLLEALAAGLPVVASGVRGYADVLGRDAATVVPPGDAAAMAEGIRRILTSPALAARLASAGRDRAREYAWPGVATLVEGVYREVTASARSAPQRAAIRSHVN